MYLLFVKKLLQNSMHARSQICYASCKLELNVWLHNATELRQVIGHLRVFSEIGTSA